MSKTISVVCKHCTRSFQKLLSEYKRSANHFCSRSCSAKLSNLSRTVTRKIKTCLTCQNTYTNTKEHRSTRFCISCKEKYVNSTEYLKAMTLKDYKQSKALLRPPSWRNADLRGLNRQWNKSLTTLPCQRCNYNLHVELCHIKSLSKSSLSETLGEINSPENNLVLCRNCHWEFDHQLLDLADISNRML